MASSATMTQFSSTPARPQSNAAHADSSGWWLALLGPVCIGLTVAAVCWLSAMSF